MITAVDTNVILDVLIPGQPFCESSKTLLERHLAKGRLVVCEIVFAELAYSFTAREELAQFLADTGMELLPSLSPTLFLAGERWAAYARSGHRNRFECPRCGKVFTMDCPHCGAAFAKRLHVLGDFLVGAHALTQADCLLSRDLGIYRSHFPDLPLVDA